MQGCRAGGFGCQAVCSGSRLASEAWGVVQGSSVLEHAAVTASLHGGSQGVVWGSGGVVATGRHQARACSARAALD